MKRWLTEPLLKVEHLTMRFGGLTAVDDVSFDVGSQDITALIGPSVHQGEDNATVAGGHFAAKGTINKTQI